MAEDSTDLASVARGILDANLYATLGTADADGNPWVAPVYFATADYRSLYWVSALDTTHSRNLLVRPRVSLVVFDSRVPAYSGQAVYMEGEAVELSGAELAEGLSVYPGSPERGASALSHDDVQPPSPYRLFRADVSAHSINCPRPGGEPCAEHGKAFDHRTAVVIS